MVHLKIRLILNTKAEVRCSSTKYQAVQRSESCEKLKL
jgi:hypothetical protein